MKYEVVIGIEIHAELKTHKKLFSPAPNIYGAAVNEKTALYDTAQPGVLPVLNKNCIDLALMASLALDCNINNYMEFDRKNYFYPDIAKGYQITQDRTPIGYNGHVSFDVDGVNKTVAITRLHIEEDTAKSIHLGEDTLLDFNRSGSPLIEIVSDASMRTAKEATRYIETLRSILLFSGVSDVRMEEGSMRCDANISIREFGQESFGTKVEIKNLNSISKVEKSLLFEIERQTMCLEANELIIQETRRFDDLTGKTVTMRIKETADDYRYHHDPNIPPVVLTNEYIEKIRTALPELPKNKVDRYINKYKLSSYDANVLTQSLEMCELIDECVKLGAKPKTVANIIMGDLSYYLNKEKIYISETKIDAQKLFDISKLFDDELISSKIMKELLILAIEEGIEVLKYVEVNKLLQISNNSELEIIVEEVILESVDAVNNYKNGHDYAFKYLVGQVMKKTNGKANPKIVTELLISKLK